MEMHKYFLVLTFLLLSVSAFAQSGRTPAGTDPDGKAAADARSIKDMFDEANIYNKVKFAEFAEKNVPYSEELRVRTEKEQRALAARLAAEAALRTEFSGDDLYYLGMLHWIAGNLDATAETLIRYTASSGEETERRQTARSIAVVASAQQKHFETAERVFGEYSKAKPQKPAELARMTAELAKAFSEAENYEKAERFAAEAYSAAKAIVKQPDGRVIGVDELLDSGMLLAETRAKLGKNEAADAALEDLRKVAATLPSPTLYYYAADKQIVHQIESGRKSLALENYANSLKRAEKDFAVKGQRDDVIRRLKRREKHYQILGEPAPELETIDEWFPGERATLAELRGKVVLIDFWATWCAPCYEAFPHLIEWQRDFGERGFMIIGVTRYYGISDGTRAERPAELAFLKTFREKEKLNYDIAVATDQSSQRAFGATSLPTAIIIDRKGIVRYAESGTNSTRMEEMREMILKLLAEE